MNAAINLQSLLACNSIFTINQINSSRKNSDPLATNLLAGPDVDSDDVVTNTRAEGVVVRGRCLLTTLHLRLHRHKCLRSREFL